MSISDEQRKALRDLVRDATSSGRRRLDSYNDNWFKKDLGVYLESLEKIIAPTKTEPQYIVHYGGRIDYEDEEKFKLHPERSAEILAAMDRHEEGKDTAADRVLLWFDVLVSKFLCDR